MSPLRNLWNSFWFEPDTADNLGLCRILFFGSLFLFYWHKDFTGWSAVSTAFWYPVWLFRVPHLPVLSTPVVVFLQSTWKLALALSCMGLFTRFSTAAAFVLGAYLLGLAQSFGKITHYDAILVFVFLIMAISRCGDSWSLDRLIDTARRGTDTSGNPTALSGEYTWPVRAAWVMLALVFFAAGVAKLRHTGLGWVTHGSLAIWLVRGQYYQSDAAPLVSWGLYLAQHRWLVFGLAASSLILETGYPLALFSRRARWIFVPGVILMQLSIRALMGPTFGQMMLCNVFWVPWDRVVGWISQRTSTKKKLVLLFDGECGRCRRTVAVVRSLDILGRVELYDAAQQWSEIRRKFPSLDQDECLSEMQAITGNGQLRSGFSAYRALAWILPLGWPFLSALYFPGAGWVGSRIYRSIAAGRHRDTCPLPRQGFVP